MWVNNRFYIPIEVKFDNRFYISIEMKVFTVALRQYSYNLFVISQPEFYRRLSPYTRPNKKEKEQL
jgi:hypothetical protein